MASTMFTGVCCSWKLPQMLTPNKNDLTCFHSMMTLFLYVLSYMLTSVIENQFYIDKACSANFGYNESVCSSLTDGNYPEAEVEIQKYVSTFTMYNNLVRQGLPILPGVLMGMWSDKCGARGPILIGMLGKTVYFLGYVLNAKYFNAWPLEYVLFTAALPRALAGYDIGIFMAVRSHISEATPQELLTQRLATMEMANQISAPVGLTIGSAIFAASEKNYTISFFISMVVSGLGLVYALLLIKNISKDREQPLKINEDTPIMKNFNICNLKSFYNHRIITILLGMVFLQSMMNDGSFQFLYTQFKFRWTTHKFSNFQTTEAICSIIASGIIVPLATKMHFSDTSVLAGGVIMVIVSRLCYTITNDERVMFLGAFTSSFQILTYITIYSMVSKNTSPQNRGKFLAVFSSVESATCLISSPMYSEIYSSTIESYPSAIFLLSSSLQLMILVLVIFLKYNIQ